MVLDIRVTQDSVYKQKVELKSLNESIAEYYHHYSDRPKTNIDIDELISQKRILQKAITDKTNFILDCENKLDDLEVKLRFISPSLRADQEICKKEENLLNFFKLLHSKGCLKKSKFFIFILLISPLQK